MARRWLLTSAAALALGGYVGDSVAQTVVHGAFGTRAEIYRSPPGPVVQTLSPNNTALSIITEGLEIRGESASRETLVLRVSVPIVPKQRATVGIAVRGEPYTEAGATCRTFLISGDRVRRFSPTSDDQVLVQWNVDVESSAKSLQFSLVVICDASKGVFLYSIDALDMAWSYTEAES